MRKDLQKFKNNERRNPQMSVAGIARQMNCSWRTANKMLHPEKYPKSNNKRLYLSILDVHKELIKEKLEKCDASAMAIYYLLKTNYEYKGSYSTVRGFVSKIKKEEIAKATIRYETSPGYQSQVDWKESLKLTSKFNEEFTINIFLIILGYSRYKFIKLTYDKTQLTLFECMTNAFEYFGGTTEEILFDNMKTVVDRAKSTFGNVVINDKFIQFAKDAGFKVRTCFAFRPRTKGKVELVAKIMNRLKAFNNEFSNIYELEEIVKRLNEDINNELVQEINIKPIERYKKETEYLTKTNIDLLSTYYISEKLYKVNKNSLISFKGKKYSVPIRFIGKNVTVKSIDETFIAIYYTTDFICSYDTTGNFPINYKESHYKEILSTSKNYKHLNAKQIEDLMHKNYEMQDIWVDFRQEENEDYSEINKEYTKQLDEFYEGVKKK